MNTQPRVDHAALQIVSKVDCLRLLGSVPLGRLVYTYGGLPAVRLVNFVLDDDTIVFSTGPGDKLRAAERGDVVAFEADEVDLDSHVSRTVTAIGHLSDVPADEASALRNTFPLHSWLPIDDPALVVLSFDSDTSIVERLPRAGQGRSHPIRTSRRARPGRDPCR